MATWYWAITPASNPTPTWARANIGTNAGFSGSVTESGAETDTQGSGSGTWTKTGITTGEAASTSYYVHVVWDDGANTSGPVHGSFTTAASSVTLTGANSTQAATSGAGAVTQ